MEALAPRLLTNADLDALDVPFLRELHEGVLYVTPSPGFRHQHAVHRLSVVLEPLATLLSTSSVRSTLERIGFAPEGHPAFLYPRQVFAARPTIRTDLPPPAPDRLRQLRSVPKPPPTTLVRP